MGWLGGMGDGSRHCRWQFVVVVGMLLGWFVGGGGCDEPKLFVLWIEK